MFNIKIWYFACLLGELKYFERRVKKIDFVLRREFFGKFWDVLNNILWRLCSINVSQSKSCLMVVCSEVVCSWVASNIRLQMLRPFK